MRSQVQPGAGGPMQVGGHDLPRTGGHCRCRRRRVPAAARRCRCAVVGAHRRIRRRRLTVGRRRRRGPSRGQSRRSIVPDGQLQTPARARRDDGGVVAAIADAVEDRPVRYIGRADGARVDAGRDTGGRVAGAAARQRTAAHRGLAAEGRTDVGRASPGSVQADRRDRRRRATVVSRSDTDHLSERPTSGVVARTAAVVLGAAAELLLGAAEEAHQSDRHRIVAARRHINHKQVFMAA